MKSIFRKNEGFTLIELLATIVTGSIVTLAAVTILLLGVRINKQSTDTASRQTTTRILLSSLEDLATEGTITGVTSTMDTWKVYGAGGEDDILYAYDSASQTICSGKKGSQTTIMEGVIASDVMLEGKLLTVTVETEDGTYSSSVYCRTDSFTDGTDKSSDERIEQLVTPNPTGGCELFLKKLASQYAITTDSGVKVKNPGLILVEKKDGDGNVIKDDEGNVIYVPNVPSVASPDEPRYYSEWYIGKAGWGQNGWNANTPWCACFISWGLNQVLGNNAPCFANVDNFKTYLQSNNEEGHRWEVSQYYYNDNGNAYKPQPGDLIFFDWTARGDLNPEHIGAVIKVDKDDDDDDNGWIYTIEGNSSNRVAVRKYSLKDPRIIGYGVLDWTTTP